MADFRLSRLIDAADHSQMNNLPFSLSCKSNEALFHVSITIPEHVSVTLIDDLECVRKETKIEVKIAVQKNAQLFYKHTLIDETRRLFSDHIFEKTLGDREIKTLSRKVVFILQEEHAHVSAHFSSFLGSNRKSKLVTLQHHQASRTTSNLVVKGVVEDEGMFFCENLIRIDKDIFQVNASQVNKNLLLSDQARAISIPKLEVLAHDVQCSHGSATSTISEDDLFYLQSRCLESHVAKGLIIRAFLTS